MRFKNINFSTAVLISGVVEVSVVDEKRDDRSLSLTPHSDDGGGRLLRLDSSVDMRLGDLGECM